MPGPLCSLLGGRFGLRDGFQPLGTGAGVGRGVQLSGAGGMRWWPLWIVMWLAPMLMASPALKAAWQSTLRAASTPGRHSPSSPRWRGWRCRPPCCLLMIGRGGDAHIRWYQRQTQMRELMRTGGGVKGLEQFGRLGNG